MKNKLTIELVPRTSWYDNVRSRVSKEDWDKIRKAQYRKANYKCEVCNEKARLECHEIWHYDDEKHRQVLVGLTALCPNCHKVKHIGRSMMQGELMECIDHIMAVNNMTEEEAIAYVDSCFVVWNERSKHEWEIDISYLELLLD